MGETFKTMAKYGAAILGGIVLDETVRFIVRRVAAAKAEQPQAVRSDAR